MLIEIHIIQNHSPANLNRDDLGAPKTCLFGGVTRARISSQCLKRSIRRSAEFKAALAGGGGVRTRHLIKEIARRAHGGGNPPDDLVKRVRKVFEDGGIGINEVEGDPDATDILWFVPESDIEEMAKVVRKTKRERNKKSKTDKAFVKNVGPKFAEILAKKAAVPDIALSGRMTEFDGKDHFKDLRSELRVEAALSAAHAISTHEVITEVDYFTAVDDLATGTGAGHVNEAMFNSACFYKYFCIDWKQLLQNLDDNKDLARTTVECFLRAAARTTPTGKQHACAAFNLPDGILVELKKNGGPPVSYANAFANPVPPKSKRGLVGESIARLGQYVHQVAEGYSVKAERFWFSPSKRYALTWIDENKKEHEKEQRVIEEEDKNVGTLDDLVSTLMAAVDGGAGTDSGEGAP